MIVAAKHIISPQSASFEVKLTEIIATLNSQWADPRIEVQYDVNKSGYYSALLLVHDD